MFLIETGKLKKFATFNWYVFCFRCAHGRYSANRTLKTPFQLPRSLNHLRPTGSDFYSEKFSGILLLKFRAELKLIETLHYFA